MSRLVGLESGPAPPRDPPSGVSGCVGSDDIGTPAGASVPAGCAGQGRDTMMVPHGWVGDNFQTAGSRTAAVALLCGNIMNRRILLLLSAAVVGAAPVAAQPPANKSKEIAGAAEVLRSVP